MTIWHMHADDAHEAEDAHVAEHAGQLRGLGEAAEVLVLVLGLARERDVHRERRDDVEEEERAQAVTKLRQMSTVKKTVRNQSKT